MDDTQASEGQTAARATVDLPVVNLGSTVENGLTYTSTLAIQNIAASSVIVPPHKRRGSAAHAPPPFSL